MDLKELLVCAFLLGTKSVSSRRTSKEFLAYVVLLGFFWLINSMQVNWIEFDSILINTMSFNNVSPYSNEIMSARFNSIHFNSIKHDNIQHCLNMFDNVRQSSAMLGNAQQLFIVFDNNEIVVYFT